MKIIVAHIHKPARTNERGIFAIARIDGICLKKLQPDGCFEYDKVITVQRFFNALKHRSLVHAERHHSD
jgi:hypothetical protein